MIPVQGSRNVDSLLNFVISNSEDTGQPRHNRNAVANAPECQSN